MGPFLVMQNSKRQKYFRKENLVFPSLDLTHFCLGFHRSEYWKLVIVHHSFTLHPITEYHRIISKYWAIKYRNIYTSTILTLSSLSRNIIEKALEIFAHDLLSWWWYWRPSDYLYSSLKGLKVTAQLSAMNMYLLIPILNQLIPAIKITHSCKH